MWKRLDHPNLLPTFGAAPEIAEFCVISPWMEGGDLHKHLFNYPGVNRVSIVRAHINLLSKSAKFAPKMIAVADGLAYLHSNGVIHGDLKGVSEIDGNLFVC